jgi:hypothetical protein
VNDGCHMQMCAWGKRSGDCRLRGASGEGTMVGSDGSMVATAVDHQEHRVRRLRILTQWTISNHLDRAPARFTFSSAVRIHHFFESPKNAIISQYHGSSFITASLDPAAQLYPRKSRVQSPTLEPPGSDQRLVLTYAASPIGTPAYSNIVTTTCEVRRTSPAMTSY